MIEIINKKRDNRLFFKNRAMHISSDVSFKEMVNHFSFEYLKCILYVLNIKDEPYLLNKKIYSKLISASHLLEDFLDFHGAKNNRNWIFYRELSAAVRYLSLAGYSQKHIFNRIGLYQLENKDDVFADESRDTLMMIQGSLELAAPIILKEAERLGIEIPSNGYEAKFFPD
ncbi:MAG: hypothetical protein HQK71_12710, partial [Desulfamplus sp.]|nr:hypothetical protein [Desulfamplus sp.]